MIQSLVYRAKLRRLFSRREKVSRKFVKYFEEAKKSKKGKGDLDGLRFEEETELDIIDYEIETLTTSYYLNVARRNFLEIPTYGDNEYWVASSLDPNHKVLSNKSITELRKKVRAERKEYLGIMVQIITTITGLTGAVIGLLAFIGSK